MPYVLHTLYQHRKHSESIRLGVTGYVAVVPGGISSLYIDMMLATSGIASGVKSYGDCLNAFFNMLVRREAHGLSDPAGGSGVILANSSIEARERLRDSVKAAADQAQAARDAQTRGGEYVRPA